MNRVVLDFETFYDREYSLAKLTTEEYVRDERFEALGVAIKIDDGPALWYPRPAIERGLRTVDWENSLVVGQNMMFDAAILAWRYGCVARAWGDTLGMSRALFPHEKSHSLAAQSSRHGIGLKGDDVVNALGKRYADFSEEQLTRYGEYCINDVELTARLFDLYATGYKFPIGELKLIDATLRMFVEPSLQLDADLLRDHLAEVRARQEEFLATTNVERMTFMSNPQFANLLREHGVEPPTKISVTTGKETYAFAKTDEEFKALAEDHPDDRVRMLVAARLGVKSTIEETRAERFLQMAGRGAFPVPLRYYGAHSGRWSGQDSINLQNLPARAPGGNTLKRAILAPPGHVIIDCDSAQIEARTLAWLAGQQDLVDAFANKQDVYRLMAAQIYGVAPDQVDKTQRQVGKTVILGCIAEGELVLTDHGLVPIEQVTTSMRVWDGVEWVTHEGPVYQGEQEVMTYDQITATPDHIVYLPNGTSCRFDEAAKSGSRIARTGDGRAPLRYDGNIIHSSASQGSGARALYSSTLYTMPDREVARAFECSTGVDQRLPTVQSTAQTSSVAGETSYRCEAAVYESPASELEALRSPRSGVSVSICTSGGAVDYRKLRTAERERSRPPQHERPLRAGEFGVVDAAGESIPHAENTTCLTNERVPSEVSRGSLCRSDFAPLDGEHDRRINHSEVLPTVMQTKRRVWDILNAGPRHRFTVSGRLVSNCGYGVGHQKLKLFLKNGAKVEVNDAEAKRIIDTYRRTYYRIPELWKRADTALAMLAAQMPMPVDAQQLIHVVPGRGLSLPSGLYIQYPDLRQFADKEGQLRWHYSSRGRTVAVFGPKVAENFTQAVARCVVGEQLLRIAKRYKPVLTVHDAVACIAPVDEAEEAQRYVEECMSWRPRWAGSLPLACEAGRGASYGDC